MRFEHFQRLTVERRESFMLLFAERQTLLDILLSERSRRRRARQGALMKVREARRLAGAGAIDFGKSCKAEDGPEGVGGGGQSARYSS